jgi:hypothetical protein
MRSVARRVLWIAAASAGFAAGLLVPNAAGAALTYRLGPGSNYQEGCFDPCLCPIMMRGDVSGTFVATPVRVPDERFLDFAIRDVRWFVRGPVPLRVVGSGTYRIDRAGSEQRLELDLQVGDDPVEHYDSGLVPVHARFPEIAVTISVHGMFCWDTVFELTARPVRTEPIRPRSVLDPLDALPAQPAGLGTRKGLDAQSAAPPVAKTWAAVKAMYREPPRR